MRPNPISRAFVAALLMATGIVLQDHRNTQSWATALGIIAAAISGGTTKRN